MKIKNILLTIFLFFIISMPVFASEANNIFMPDITKDQIKIEVNDDTGAHTYYLNRTYTAPTYKQYL